MKRIFLALLVCYALTFSGCETIQEIQIIQEIQTMTEYSKRSDTPLYSLDAFEVHRDDFEFIMKQYPEPVDDRKYNWNEKRRGPVYLNNSFETTKNCYAALRDLSLEDVQAENFFSLNELLNFMESLAGKRRAMRGGSEVYIQNNVRIKYMEIGSRNKVYTYQALESHSYEYKPEEAVEQLRSVGNFIVMRSFNTNRKDSGGIGYVIYYFEKL